MKKKNNKAIVWGLVAAVVLIAALLMIQTSSSSMKLNGNDFVEKFVNTSNAVMLDVRTPSEFTAGHIDRAINVDFENQSFESEIKKLDTSKTYFVYCRSGNRSSKAVSIMRNNGYKNIVELQGGISAAPELLK